VPLDYVTVGTFQSIELRVCGVEVQLRVFLISTPDRRESASRE
jgi:hypothetical protein